MLKSKLPPGPGPTTSAVTHSIFENSSSSFFELTDKGRFAGVGGTEGTEKNKEGSGKSNVLLQFSEVEVQTKRLRLDPQETRQKTDLCSSVRQNKLSSTRSKFNQASAQQTSKKSGKKLTIFCKNSVVFISQTYRRKASCNTGEKTWKSMNSILNK